MANNGSTHVFDGNEAGKQIEKVFKSRSRKDAFVWYFLNKQKSAWFKRRPIRYSSHYYLACDLGQILSQKPAVSMM